MGEISEIPPSTATTLRLQLAVACLVMFAEGFFFTQMFPFAAHMVGDMRGTLAHVGLYTGMIYGANSMGAILSVRAWARASNKYGLRRCLFVSLTISLIASMIMAWTESFPVSFVTLLVRGTVNCNLLITRTGLRKSYHSRGVNDTQAFASVSVAFGASCILGPALGGLLYGLGPSYLRPWTVPMLMGTATYGVSFLMAARCMEEPAGAGSTQVAGKITEMKPLMVLLVMAGGHSYVYTGWELAYPLLAGMGTGVEGENWSPADIGSTFMVGSIGLMSFSLLGFAVAARRVGLIRLWVISWCIATTVLFTFPRVLTAAMGAGVEPKSVWVRVLNYGAQLVISILLGGNFVTIQVMVNSYVATRADGGHVLALANGWLASAQAFVRATSPLATGSLFTLGVVSESDHGMFGRSLAFDQLAVVAAICCIGAAWSLPGWAVEQNQAATKALRSPLLQAKGDP